MKPEHINLAYKDGKSDKVYNVYLKNREGAWDVFVQFGRRGRMLKEECKCDELDYESAKHLYDNLVASKIKKGYYDENGKPVGKPLVEVLKPFMGGRIYGASDDLIEVEGGKARGEVGCYGTDDSETGVLMVCSDGTLLEVKYGKNDDAIWGIKLIKKGELFDRIDQCDNAEGDIYSDIAYFKETLEWVYAAKEWEKVQ